VVGKGPDNGPKLTPDQKTEGQVVEKETAGSRKNIRQLKTREAQCNQNDDNKKKRFVRGKLYRPQNNTEISSHQADVPVIKM